MTMSKSKWIALALIGLAGRAQAQLAAGDPAGQFSMSDWASGLNNATDVVFLPDGRAVVTRKTGEAAVLAADGSVLQPMAFKFTVDSGSEKGLLGVVRDPASGDL